ncbi:MAG: amidohydrolase family protein [Planctomycetaceae bacterium]|nr:amidohydrolase family protein [Planctomycetaceae bacterium]
MPIWDLHAHLSGIDGSTPEERMVRLLEIADRMGVERLIVFMGYPFSYDPSPEDLRNQNDQVLQALSHHHDRAFGFVYVNPKHTEASLAEIDRCIANGPMVGIKLWVAMRCNDPALDPIVKRAVELDALVFQHTWYKSQGNLPGESTPEELAELAARHPTAKIICGHTGSDWERGIRAIRNSPNVSVDLGGNDPTAGFVEMALRELGPERILYGSDVPGRSFATQLGKVYGARIPEADRRLILGDNLKRLLRPILTAKGVRV